MNEKRIQEIMDMFPEGKPVVFNYATSRAAVMELIDGMRRYEPQTGSFNVTIECSNEECDFQYCGYCSYGGSAVVVSSEGCKTFEPRILNEDQS